MDIAHEALLLLTGLIAGVTASVAGGGLLLIYPILLALGVPPVSASATGGIALLPAQLSSDYGYRKLLLGIPKRYYILAIPLVIGTLIGASLLARTPNQAFESIVPWFILMATVLIVLQPALHKWLHTREAKALERRYHAVMFVVVFVVMLLLSVYGGYFGAGVGIMLLAFLGIAGPAGINRINALKNVFALIINCISCIYFANVGLIEWGAVPMLLVGGALGGYFGSVYAAKLPTKMIRGIIIAIALTVTTILFMRLLVR